MRIFLRFIALILGLAIGVAAGGYFAYSRYVVQFPLVRNFASIASSNALSMDEFDKKADSAKQDLISTLAMYEGAAETPNVESGVKKALHMNCGLIEARLSVVESRGGNAARAKAYMLKAQADLKAVGWTDTSEESILQVVNQKPASLSGN